MDYKIVTFWAGGQLSWLEQLSLISYRDLGYDVHVYSYSDIQNLPERIQIKDANDIIPREDLIKSIHLDPYALFSDIFRYHLLKTFNDVIWADMDTYCIRKFEPNDGYIFAYENDHRICGAVLRLPPESKALSQLIDFTNDRYPLPPWARGSYALWLKLRKAVGLPVHVTRQKRGVWGPQALTWFLQRTGEDRHALPRESLYPFGLKHERHKMLEPDVDFRHIFDGHVYSIHFFGAWMRRYLHVKYEGRPHPESLVGRLIARHDIDITAAPLPLPPSRSTRIVVALRKLLQI